MESVTFDKAVDIIIEYYISNKYCVSKIYSFKKAIKTIKIHPNYLDLDLIINSNWLKEKQNDMSHSQFKILRNALYLIRSVIKNGKVIQTSFIYDSSPFYYQLNESFRLCLDDYLIICKNVKKYSNDYIESIKQKCSRRILFLQKNGIINPSLITFKSLKSFCYDAENNNHKTISSSNRYNTTFSHFISYISKKYNKPKTLKLMLNLHFVKDLVFIEDIHKSEQIQFYGFLKTSNYNSTDNCLHLLECYEELITKSNYSKEEKSSALFFLNSLKLFIDANALCYSINLLKLWVNYYISNINPLKKTSYNKYLFRLAQLSETGQINFSIINLNKETNYMIPKWSSELLNDYLEERKAQGKSKSTLCIDHSSIVRFLKYLEQINITSLAMISSQTIIDFQIQDKHDTSEGKNAYRTRIRAFIQFLARKNLVSELLLLAFLKTNNDIIKIIKVLDDNQRKTLYSFVENCKTHMEYRISAMIVLALNLGLRNCDIINLKFSNIDWINQKITFIQQKTNVITCLPMPNIVANCLYRYISEGIPNLAKNTNYIFVKHRMPYEKLNSNVLRIQTNSILLKNKCKIIKGSHTLRKDFATSQLRKQKDYQTIISSLGQTSPDSITSYLSLDTINIRKCCINLNGIEIKEGLYE